MSSDLYLRSQNGDANGTWNPWVRLYHTGNKPTPKEIGAGAYAGPVNFGETSGSWTTDEFIAFIKSLGVISSDQRESWSASGNWSYAVNKMINTAGSGDVGYIPLAGSFVEVIGNSSSYIIRITTPTTTSGGFSPNGASREFVYVNNGPTYAPGWRASYNTDNKPQPIDLGTTASTGNTLAMRDSMGDIHCRLLRSEYPNQDNIGGGIAYRNNNSSDNYIRFCTNQAAVRSWLGLDVGNDVTFNTIVNTGSIFMLKKNARRHIAFNNGTNTDAYIYKDPDNTAIKINHGVNQLGGGELQILRNCGLWVTGRLNKADEGEGAAALRCSPEGGSFSSWKSRNSALQIDCPEADNSAYNVWKATKWGSNHIAAMQVHLGGVGYVKLAVMESEFTFEGNGGFVASGNGNFNDVYIRSDIRDKRNVKYIENPLERIKQICGVQYEVVNPDGWKPSAGLLAQHVKNALPVAVCLDKNFRGDPRLRVNYNAVTGLLVNCVNALETKLESAIKEIINLREAYDELKTQVDLGINT